MKIKLNPKLHEASQFLRRPELNAIDLQEMVANIFLKVQQEGDTAVREFTQKFDNIKIEELQLSLEIREQLVEEVAPELRKAIVLAKENIERFHKAQVPSKISVETMPGVVCWQEAKPIEKVGIYIPGGSAPLFSTVLMLAIPAAIAGCKEIILCTPPDKSGKINPAIAFAALISGVTSIYCIGGIQAIAAMTYGTETVPKVYKIFGPGNQYVTAAKQYAQTKNCAIDMPAGPSELMVVADNSCSPDFVASDLLSQAEHGVDSQVVCLVENLELAELIQKAVDFQLRELPRQSIAVKALENSSILVVPSAEDTLALMNEYAPEHLIICRIDEQFLLDGLINAGSVFIGNYTPESAGDYASGTNHTLPTNGFARQYSGVNLDAFVKKITYQKITRAGIKNIGAAIELMAEAEGLTGHKNAVSLRLKTIDDGN